MRLSCPCAPDRMSLLHKRLVDRTARRQKKNRPPGQPRVFSLPASAAAGGRAASEPNPASLFHLTQEQIPLYAQVKYPACLARGGNVVTVGRTDVHVFGGIAPFSRALCELKEAADRSLETQTHVRRSELFQSCGISALMYSARFVCVRVCVH